MGCVRQPCTNIFGLGNPFYSSYLLAYLASVVTLPGSWAAGVFVVMLVFLASVARFEERKFAASPLADAYETYSRRTGRFLSKLRR